MLKSKSYNQLFLHCMQNLLLIICHLPACCLSAVLSLTDIVMHMFSHRQLSAVLLHSHVLFCHSCALCCHSRVLFSHIVMCCSLTDTVMCCSLKESHVLSPTYSCDVLSQTVVYCSLTDTAVCCSLTDTVMCCSLRHSQVLFSHRHIEQISLFCKIKTQQACPNRNKVSRFPK